MFALGDVHLSDGEILILRALLKRPHGSSELRIATAYSREGFHKAIRSLERKELIKKTKGQFEKAVTYSLAESHRKQVEERLKDDPINIDRYSALRKITERILAEEKDRYVQYAMLLSLFSQWGNTDLHWVQRQMTWAALALVSGDKQTYQDLRRTVFNTFTRCIQYIFALASSYPVVAIAFIESSEDQWISDVLDDYYPEGGLPTRDVVLSEAMERTHQPRLPTYRELQKNAKELLEGSKWDGTGYVDGGGKARKRVFHGTKDPARPIVRPREQILKILSLYVRKP